MKLQRHVNSSWAMRDHIITVHIISFRQQKSYQFLIVTKIPFINCQLKIRFWISGLFWSRFMLMRTITAMILLPFRQWLKKCIIRIILYKFDMFLMLSSSWHHDHDHNHDPHQAIMSSWLMCFTIINSRATSNRYMFIINLGNSASKFKP